jgi:hypothetical protein
LHDLVVDNSESELNEIEKEEIKNGNESSNEKNDILNYIIFSIIEINLYQSIF